MPTISISKELQNSNLPIQPNNPELVQQYIEIYNSLKSNTTNVYLSHPINGGPRFLKWFKTKGQLLDLESKKCTNSFNSSVVTVNKKAANKKTESLLENKTLQKFYKFYNIINPAAVYNEVFTQNDYLYLWQNIIETKIGCIIFAPGWEYSIGCSFEYMIALKNKVDSYSYDKDLSKMDRINCLNKLDIAKEALDSFGLWTSFHEEVYKGIKK